MRIRASMTAKVSRLRAMDLSRSLSVSFIGRNLILAGLGVVESPQGLVEKTVNLRVVVSRGLEEVKSEEWRVESGECGLRRSSEPSGAFYAGSMDGRTDRSEER